MAWAVEQKIPATKKIVLLMLANRTNSDTGKCVPKIKTLADDCGLSESATKAALKELAELGLIKAHQRFYEGQQLPNQYELCPDGVGLQKTPPRLEKTPVGQQVATESGKEPGKEPKEKRAAEPRSPSTAKNLQTFIDECQAAGVKPIPDDHYIRTYAADAGIRADMMGLCWIRFVEDHTEGTRKAKKYKDWGQAFANCVKDNWYGFWYVADGVVHMSSKCELFKAAFDAKRSREK